MGFKNLIRNKILDYGYYVQRTPSASLIKSRISKFKINTNIQKKFSYDRFGSTFDGGYVIPLDFEGIDLCLSAGVENRIDFESSLYDKTGIQCDLIDGSMSKFENLPTFANFTSINLGPTNTKKTISLKNWIRKFDQFDEFILQCDIEGHEYDVFLSTQEEYIKRLRIIILEIHNVFNIFSNDENNNVDKLMSKLLITHSLLHVHCNNCSDILDNKLLTLTNSLELTFIRNDRIHKKKNKKPISSNPSNFDKPNNPNIKNINFKIKF